MTNGRKIIITDIHGEFEKFQSLLDKISPVNDDEFIFLGDYIDRGKNPQKVIDKIIEISRTNKCTCLKGSHEYAYLHARMGDEYYKFLFWNYGGIQTAECYGGFDEIYQVHGDFLEGLKPYYMTDKYLFIHAGIRPGIPFEEQNEKDFYYIRWDFINNPHNLPQKIIFGHTDFKDVQIQPDKICIDTGCGKYPDAHLTAMIISPNGGESYVES